MRELLLFLPIVLFLFLLLLTSIWLENRKTTEKSLEDFYLSDRNLEGFVLAMSMIATYGSVSSFVSGPGVAWQLGLGWVVFAAPQIIAGFLVFGVIGKKFAIVGHRIGAVTVIDLIRARFADLWLARLLALTLLVAFVTMMTGQLIGGARLFAAAAGLPYEAGLVLFGLVTVFYTTLGGYRAVVIPATICALLMVAGCSCSVGRSSISAAATSRRSFCRSPKSTLRSRPRTRAARFPGGCFSRPGFS